MHRFSSTELRSKYIEFFVERGHVAIPSASLVPANDPTVLFTTAGMHPLVPFLLGEPHPEGKRLVNSQRCVRTGDIDLIGDDTHLTLFEMLGNWSLGDYFREESITWSFEFLMSLGLPLERLGVTCFESDHESAEIWTRLGMKRIQFLGRDDNWWGPAGKTGPCGPDTEIFYWVGEGTPPSEIDVQRDSRWVEIWNNVFMSYTQNEHGEIAPLPGRVNVDTGMGLERTLVALNGLRSVYETDTIAPLFEELTRLATKPNDRDLRVLTDHLRASRCMIEDGVGPSNKDRGYILRRLLRRCVVIVRRLGLPVDWYRCGGHESSSPPVVLQTIEEELSRFERTLTQGLRILEKTPLLDGKAAFDLFQTYGFPFELTSELAEADGKRVDREGFLIELEKHRTVSRTTSVGEYSGGLSDPSSTEIVRYHTLTHLLQSALRTVLGPHVIQRGSNITRERLRFDFSHDKKLSSEELTRVSSIVNGWLSAGTLIVERSTMTESEARSVGAIGAFGEKYGSLVSVYTVSDSKTGEVISREFCGGPHVGSTTELNGGTFRILREQGISTGIRRIKAVFEATRYSIVKSSSQKEPAGID